MMIQSLSLLCVVFWLSISGSFEAEPEVIFSSNATSVEIGKSVKLTCELKNFVPGTEFYGVYFHRDYNFFSYYHISATNSSGQRITEFYNNTSLQPSLGRQSVSSIFPVYEITVTPTVESTKEYHCRLFQNTPTIIAVSKRLSINATNARLSRDCL